MKKIPVAAISLVFIPGIVQAQQTNLKGKTDTTVNKNEFNLVAQVIPISEMDQRKIYRWDNGQGATPSGRQAGDPSARYARVLGDSAVVVNDWTEKIKGITRASAKH